MRVNRDLRSVALDLVEFREVSGCSESATSGFEIAGVLLRFLNENFFGGLNVLRTTCSFSDRLLMC